MTTPEPAPARGPVPPRELGRALTEAFRSLRQQPDGTHRMTVRLDPPELGSVHIRLVAHGDTVHVTMRSDATGATSALNAQRSDIEAVLRGEGLDLGSFDVHGEDRRPQQGQPARRGDIALDDEPETFTAAADTALRL